MMPYLLKIWQLIVAGKSRELLFSQKFATVGANLICIVRHLLTVDLLITTPLPRRQRSQQSAKARQLLRTALTREHIDISDDILNSPGKQINAWLQHTHQRFLSISHCPTATAIAVSEHPVGIDCESAYRIRPWQAMAETAFSPEESQAIQNTLPHQQASAFLRLWTLKEAGMKAVGNEHLLHGLAHIRSSPANERDDWQGWQCEIGDTVITLCAWQQHVEPIVHWRENTRLDWQRVGISC